MTGRRSLALLVVLATALAIVAVALTPAPHVHAADTCLGGVDGDYDGDGLKDIAIGDPDAKVGEINAGYVQVRYAGTDYIQEISEDTVGIPGAAEEDDEFGWSLASYDYNQDGCSDLVVGAPYESIGSVEGAGMVTVIPGSPEGLWTQGAYALSQNSPGMPGTAETPDRFGFSLAAGNTRNGEPFLAIGVPYESIGGSRRGIGAGAVDYIRGSLNVLIHQDTPGVPGGAEMYDHFGDLLSATRDHLVVSTPGEDLVHDGTNREDAGAVHVFPHAFSSTGVPKWAVMIDQDSPGVSGVPEAGDRFGGLGGNASSGLSAIAYRPNGVSDSDAGTLVAVGVPGEDLGRQDPYSNMGDGVVHLLYVSRTGSVRQLWNLHQDTVGVAGGAEPKDEFGQTTLLLGSRDGEATTPDTAKLLVAVPGEQADGAVGAVQLFSVGGEPGDDDIWIGNGHFGLHYTSTDGEMASTGTNLYLGGEWYDIFIVPWSNIVSGTSLPVGEARPVRSTYSAGWFGEAML